MARILIQEPVDETRELIEHLVARLGHDVVGADAPLAELRDVDVLMVEPAVPGFDEREATLRVTALRARHPRAQLVIASIYPPSPAISSLSPAAYLHKPFSLAALASALTTALAAA